MKLGVAGTGMIAKWVVPHLGEWGCPPTAISYNSPHSQDAARELAAPYQAEVFSSYEDMLARADIDTVYLAVPNNAHYRFALQAFEAGKHVIMEKPFASNVREAEHIAAVARECNLLIYEAISTRYMPNYAHIKSLLPRIGQIKVASINFSQYSSRYDAFTRGEILPAFNPAMSGGALMDLGVYNLHFLQGLFGTPKLVSYVANIERDIDTSGVATLDYGSHKAVAICAKDCAAPLHNVIEGNKGYILVTTPVSICGEVTLHLNDGTEERYNDNPNSQWESEFRAFAKIFDKADYAACYEMLEDSLAVMRTLDEARRMAGIVFPADEAV